MTRKVYKTAMGKTIDLGALLLQNEHVRAVGNMNVNARGDVLDSTNQVIEKKTKQVQKHYKKQTNTSNVPVQTSNKSVKKPKAEAPAEVFEPVVKNVIVEEPAPVDVAEPAAQPAAETKPRGGLAAAIAKSRSIKQELEKTPRQLAQERAGVKRI